MLLVSVSWKIVSHCHYPDFCLFNTVLIIKIKSTIQIIALSARPWCPSHQLKFNYINLTAQNSTSNSQKNLPLMPMLQGGYERNTALCVHAQGHVAHVRTCMCTRTPRPAGYVITTPNDLIRMSDFCRTIVNVG